MAAVSSGCEENVASVLAPSSGLTANSQDFSQTNYQPFPTVESNPLQKEIASVLEICRKETLPCTLSLLGFHLSTGIKEKNWRGEFLDLLSLLPSSKEFIQKAGGKDDKAEEDRRRPINKNFINRLQAFLIFASVLCERHPEKITGLFQHLDIILEAYKNFEGTAWFIYDESFRQKLAVHPILQWGTKVNWLMAKPFSSPKKYV